jgi:hypothetical protein
VAQQLAAMPSCVDLSQRRTLERLDKFGTVRNNAIHTNMCHRIAYNQPCSDGPESSALKQCSCFFRSATIGGGISHRHRAPWREVLDIWRFASVSPVAHTKEIVPDFREMLGETSFEGRRCGVEAGSYRRPRAHQLSSDAGVGKVRCATPHKTQGSEFFCWAAKRHSPNQ